MRFHKRIPAFLTGCLMALSVVGGVSASAVSITDDETLRTYTEILVSHINDARVAEGMQELYIAPVLSDYAQIRAEELPIAMRHDRPDGSPCFSVMKNDGFWYNVAAENIAAGESSPLITFDQFMNSSGHRANIMTPDMTHIGIGYCFAPEATPEPDHVAYTYYWSMILIGSYDPNSTPNVYEGQYIPEREPGDADGSKQINAADAARVQQYSAEMRSGTEPQITRQFRDAADVNGDGNINAIDAQIILSYSAARGSDPNAELSSFIWG